MSGDDPKRHKADMEELAAAGFPMNSGVPDGINKTADWTSLADIPSGSGVPDGINKTADWTGLDDSFPSSSGVPDGIDKTADWTGMADAMSTPAPNPTGDGRGKLGGGRLRDVLEAARTSPGLNKKIDFDSLPSVQAVPTGSGAPTGHDATQDWTGIPTGSGAPAGHDATQDWTGIPTNSGAPAGSNATQDWTNMADLANQTPSGSGIPNTDHIQTKDWSFDRGEDEG